MNLSDKIITDGVEMEPAKVLTIAGSDSGGAAGLQADLKTFTALKVYGMSVITAVTAQNSLRVEAVYPLEVELIVAQLEAVLSDYGAAAIKIGFIGRVEVVEAIAAKLAAYHTSGNRFHLIVDPVLVNHRGESMFPRAVTQAYLDHLVPAADLVTPNLHEATLLTGRSITSLVGLETAARALHAAGSRWVLLKGGRVEDDGVDLLSDGRRMIYYRSPWINTDNTHGSGDTLSAAICANLARGLTIKTAVEEARRFTHAAIQGAMAWSLGAGHGPVSHW